MSLQKKYDQKSINTRIKADKAGMHNLGELATSESVRRKQNSQPSNSGSKSGGGTWLVVIGIIAAFVYYLVFMK